VKHKASVAIIGGGIVGTSIAYNLSQKGIKDTVLLEKGKFGKGSTSASLGGFRHQFSNDLSIKLSKESIKIIEKFEVLTGYDPLVRKDGYLFVASTEQSFSQIKRNRGLALGLGIKVELLSHTDLQTRFPFYQFDGVIGGTLCMDDGHASTAAVLQGFISKSRENGADLNEDVQVTKIERCSANSSYLLSTTSGDIEAEKVVIACGAFSSEVGRLASVNIPIRPFPRKILITHSFHIGVPSEIPLIIDVDSTLGIGREGNGILIADNLPTESSFDLTFPEDYDERVISAAIKRIPALKSASVSYTNSGLYEMTPDANPIVSEITGHPGLYCCAGFAGHGFMHAPIIGELMAEILSGSKPHLDISSFDIERFGNETANSNEGLII
jgi:sarcosine oxidase subunit beta